MSNLILKGFANFINNSTGSTTNYVYVTFSSTISASYTYAIVNLHTTVPPNSFNNIPYLSYNGIPITISNSNNITVEIPIGIIATDYTVFIKSSNGTIIFQQSTTMGAVSSLLNTITDFSIGSSNITSIQTSTGGYIIGSNITFTTICSNIFNTSVSLDINTGTNNYNSSYPLYIMSNDTITISSNISPSGTGPIIVVGSSIAGVNNGINCSLANLSCNNTTFFGSGANFGISFNNNITFANNIILNGTGDNGISFTNNITFLGNATLNGNGNSGNGIIFINTVTFSNNATINASGENGISFNGNVIFSSSIILNGVGINGIGILFEATVIFSSTTTLTGIGYESGIDFNSATIVTFLNNATLTGTGSSNNSFGIVINGSISSLYGVATFTGTSGVGGIGINTNINTKTIGNFILNGIPNNFNITPPIAGAIPSTTVTIPNITNTIEWTPIVTSVFACNTVYTAIINGIIAASPNNTIIPINYFKFNNSSNNITTTYNILTNSVTITISFSQTLLVYPANLIPTAIDKYGTTFYGCNGMIYSRLKQSNNILQYGNYSFEVIGGIAVDYSENLYISETFTNTIWLIQKNTGNKICLITEINQPTALVFSDNILYYASYIDGSISMWSGNPKNAAQGGTSIFLPTGLNGCISLTIDHNGNLYSANYNNNTVTKISPTHPIVSYIPPPPTPLIIPPLATISYFGSIFPGIVGVAFNNIEKNLYVATNNSLFRVSQFGQNLVSSSYNNLLGISISYVLLKPYIYLYKLNNRNNITYYSI